MADPQQEQDPHARDMNPREDRLDDERKRELEDSEVEPEPSDKPCFRS